ncbi:MAG: alanine--glyoxylate aminotransferase family protein [Chloroflexi bacterium]|nr:alanine--glyoxylate aminotransferase family protein [Chloroflexota bacterium]
MAEIPYRELNPPARILLGPGPSNVSSRVLRALTAPLLGYLDPDFMQIMDDVASMLRYAFGTHNDFTLPVSGTGSAGMEAGLANLLEPGDTLIVGVKGFFGERLMEVAARHGAKVVPVQTEWGRPLDLDNLRREFRRQGKVKVLAVVHAETSTGVLQPLEDVARLAREHDALLLVDAVTSLGGTRVAVDDWGIDFCYSATQKCIGAPPGLAPITVSTRAMESIRNRREKPRSWYLDVGLLSQYWATGQRVYHHTAPISMIYALREALRMLMEEGLERRWERHQRNGRALRAGLEALGLRLLVPEEWCTYQLTAVVVPEGVEDVACRMALLREYNIEVGGGLGKLRGKIWRIGLMGESCSPANVFLLLSALEALLPRFGFEVPAGAGVAAASKTLAGAR